MNCKFVAIGPSKLEGFTLYQCARQDCGIQSQSPHGPEKIRNAENTPCRGWPLANEYREWLALFSAAAGITQALAICQYVRWRAKGSKLEELPPGVPQPNVLPIPAPSEGPGTELKKILDSLGAKRTGGCGCEAMIAKMNTWGSECRAHRAEIVQHLRTAYEQLDWTDAAGAMMAGVLAAWSLRLNPLDPLGSLVDEAIRRSELHSPDERATMPP